MWSALKELHALVFDNMALLDLTPRKLQWLANPLELGLIFACPRRLFLKVSHTKFTHSHLPFRSHLRLHLWIALRPHLEVATGV